MSVKQLKTPEQGQGKLQDPAVLVNKLKTPEERLRTHSALSYVIIYIIMATIECMCGLLKHCSFQLCFMWKNCFVGAKLLIQIAKAS